MLWIPDMKSDCVPKKGGENMADGKIVESGEPKALFDNPKEVRTQEFLAQVL